MKVEDNINSAFAAFLNNPVKPAEVPVAVLIIYFSSLVIIVEISEPEGDTHAVETHLLDSVKVIFGYPVVFICIYKLICAVNAEPLGQNFKGRDIVLSALDGRHPRLVYKP